MRLLRHCVFALGAVALSACAGTHDGIDAAAYYAQDFTCRPSDAKTVELTKLEHRPQAFAGTCVRVTAYARGNILYADANAAGAAKPATATIGLDWADSKMARRLLLGPSFVTLTGRLRLCSRRQAIAASAAAPHPETGCRGAVAALTVSKAAIVPTAMD